MDQIRAGPAGMVALRLYLRSFGRPLAALLAITGTGAVGYHTIEGMPLFDALYMTVITLSTVGFREVQPLSSGGRIFTMFLVFGGMAFYGVTLNAIVRLFIEQRFSDLMREIQMQNTIRKLTDHYIICGGGTTARAIAVELERTRQPFVLIEHDPDALTDKRGEWPIIHDDALKDEVLEAAGISKARGLAAVLTTDADNLFVVLSARKINPGLRIHSRIEMEKSRAKMYQAGADMVISPRRAGGIQIARSMVNPEVHDRLSIFLDSAANLEFELKVHVVGPEDPYAGSTLREANFRTRGYIVIAATRPDQQIVFAPQADFLIEQGTELMMIGQGSAATASA